MDPASLPPALGNAHLLLLHLPVGFMVAAVLIELWTWRDAAGRRLLEKLLAANACFTVLTAVAGLILAAQGDYPEAPLEWHRWTGVGCAVFAALAWWLRARKSLLAGRIGLGLLAVATSVAGHFGATLTHGEGLMAWSARPAPPPVSAAPASPSDVHPLLVQHCVECHGPKKQKGRLRLDTLAAAKAEGRSGERGVVPGDPATSEILHRVNLPRTDEETMPPGDLKPLTTQERDALTAWVMSLRPD